MGERRDLRTCVYGRLVIIHVAHRVMTVNVVHHACK